MPKPITRRTSIKLTAKGAAALIAAFPHLSGCGSDDEGRRTESALLRDSPFEPNRSKAQTESGPPRSPNQGRQDTERFDDSAKPTMSDAEPATPDDKPSSASDDMTAAESMEDKRVGTNAQSRDMDESTPPLDWETFLERIRSLANIQFSIDWDMDAYVADVALLMASLNMRDPALIEAYANYANEMRDFPEINSSHEEALFEVTTVVFEAGEAIELHDHPDMTGVILCVSGEIHIENFDQLDFESPSNEIRLRRTDDRVLRSGDVGTLTATKGNIHRLEATKFTTLLDVFTPPYNGDRSDRSRWFRRDNEPIADGDGITYRAWQIG